MLGLQKVAFSVDSLRLLQSLSKKLKGGFKKNKTVSDSGNGIICSLCCSVFSS